MRGGIACVCVRAFERARARMPVFECAYALPLSHTNAHTYPHTHTGRGTGPGENSGGTSQESSEKSASQRLRSPKTPGL